MDAPANYPAPGLPLSPASLANWPTGQLVNQSSSLASLWSTEPLVNRSTGQLVLG